MSERLTKLGIKQVIRPEWMDYTLDLMLLKMKPKDIRNELTLYLEDKKQSGGLGERGTKTFILAVNILMKSWVTPINELITLRNECLMVAQKNRNSKFALHWLLISSAYPFWENTASVIGQLFTFQKVISKQQILNRLKEIYGDRQTVSRNSRYAIRSLVAWDVIQDSKKPGCYIQAPPKTIEDSHLISLLYESIMMNRSGYQLSFSKLISSPSLFHFSYSQPLPENLCKSNPRLTILTRSFHDYIFKLNV